MKLAQSLQQVTFAELGRRDRSVSLSLEGSAEAIIEAALREDLGGGDITSLSVIPAEVEVEALVVFKAPGVVAGLPVAARTFHIVDPSLEFEVLLPDGSDIRTVPVTCGRVRGKARSILAGERVALNFLQRLSGIATTVRRFAELARPHGISILDTRKTTPCLRLFERYAVAVGGGANHRAGLFDAILIKDNHIALAGGISAAVAGARNRFPANRIEVETTTLDEVREAAEVGVDVILLDNMHPDEVRQAVRVVGGRCSLEVSGGITLETVSRYLIPGVDAISVGSLTHSVRSVDISLEVETKRC